MSFLRLIRPINLAIIAVIMYGLRYFVVLPGLMRTDTGREWKLLFSDLNFFLLVLSTILLAAAGNIINDYFDLRADRINKPEKVIVGRHVKRRIAMASHMAFQVIAVLLGLYLAWQSGIWQLGFIFLFAAASLWFYSTGLKRQFLIGNIVIALLAAIVPAQVALFDVPLLVRNYGSELATYYEVQALMNDPSDYFKGIAMVCFVYAGFAFLTTLARELQKDLADIKGDKAVGCRTVPIVLGDKATKGFIALLCGFIIFMMIAIYRNYFVPDSQSILFYLLGAVALPILVSAALTIRASNRKQHLLASQFMKIAMVTAIALPAIFDLWQSVNL